MFIVNFSHITCLYTLTISFIFVGIITKSIDGNNLDIILMHHEILVDTDICIIIDNEKKCTKKRMSSATISESKNF